MFKIETQSPAQTRALGKKIGHLLQRGDVVALEGPLGAGKTTLVKGIAEGLGVKDPSEVVSPTFVLIHEYEARKKIYHIDWYRLSKVEGEDELLAQECFDSEGVTLVEWADRGKKILPKFYLRICLKYKSPEKRTMEFTAKGTQYKKFLERLSS